MIRIIKENGWDIYPGSKVTFSHTNRCETIGAIAFLYKDFQVVASLREKTPNLMEDWVFHNLPKKAQREMLELLK